MRLTEMIVVLLLTVAIGLAMATQTAVNSQLREHLNSPIQAAFFSFLIGTLCLAALMLLESAPRPSLEHFSSIPLWLWGGGLLGVYCICMSIYTAPRLGFLTFTGLVLCGQVLMSMLLDHFGWLGVEKHPIQWPRLVGAILMMIGIIFTLQR